MAPELENTESQYVCGSLKYNKFTLAMVFFWLMLGGMSMSVALTLPGSLLPVQLKEMAVPNWQTSALLTFIGGVFNMTVCPIVSFQSDRYRSRWGRRIPFIIITLPFLAIALVLFAFNRQIGAAAANYFGTAPVTTTMTLLALIMILFQFFYMFVGSVFWYIFNDVIPSKFFGRIIGAFQIASAAGLALYNGFIFGYAGTHSTEIFVAGAALYLVGMGAMCLFLKEGEYPPPPPKPARPSFANRVETFLEFFRETFFHRFYVMRFVLCSLLGIGAASFVFNLFYQQELGLEYDQIGKMNGLTGTVSLVSTFGVTLLVSILIDRWHPFRIYIYNIFFMLLATALPWKFLFGTLPANVYIQIVVGTAIAGCVLATLSGIAGMPMEMTTFPKSRFGQFCAAQALLRSTCTTVMAIGVGIFFDLLKIAMPDNPSFIYRFVPIWQFAWTIPAAILAYFLYREWGKLGGYENFAPPATWEPSGREIIDQPQTELPSRKLLALTMLLMDLLPLALIGASMWMIWYFSSHEQPALAREFQLWALPFAVLTLVAWIVVRIGLMRDIARCRRGEMPKNGIPHHGMLLLIVLKQLALAGLCVYQLWVLRDRQSLWFLLFEIATALLLVLLIKVLSRMERGIVTSIRLPA